MRKIKYHIYFWLAYFLFEINAEFVYLHHLFPDFSWQKKIVISVLAEFTCLIFTEALAFYIILIILDGRVSFINSKIKKSFFAVLVFMFFVIMYRLVSHDLIYPYYIGVPEDISRFSQFGIFNSIMNISFAVALALGFEKFIQQSETQNRLLEVSKEKTDSELKLLKAQINPHFLFNTLNNIYGLSLQKSDETSEIILKLAKIMRYNIFESAKNKVCVQKEIENIQDFIDIQKIRHKLVRIEFNHSIDDELQEISPLLLLQFVENAFKHGVSESRFDSFIRINLSIRKKTLIYEIENSKEQYNGKESSKIGLKNIKRQLDLLYPKHHLEINNKDDLYSVTLKILFE